LDQLDCRVYGISSASKSINVLAKSHRESHLILSVFMLRANTLIYQIPLTKVLFLYSTL